MTRDDVIRMAREAWTLEFIPDSDVSKLEHFAVLVAAAERVACAKVCEEIEDEYRERESIRYAELRTDAQTGASDCAYRIRAREAAVR